jgi:hypothetical protein
LSLVGLSPTVCCREMISIPILFSPSRKGDPAGVSQKKNPFLIAEPRIADQYSVVATCTIDPSSANWSGQWGKEPLQLRIVDQPERMYGAESLRTRCNNGIIPSPQQMVFNSCLQEFVTSRDRRPRLSPSISLLIAPSMSLRIMWGQG